MSQMTQKGAVPELTLGWRLRMARESTGMGLREFAESIGVAPDTCTSAEKDRRQARRITILAYAAATGVDRHWLETGEVAASPDPDDTGPGREAALRRLADRKRGRTTGKYPKSHRPVRARACAA